MMILVINSGSSSLKYALINTKYNSVFAKGLCERIGISNPVFNYKNILKSASISKEADIKNHEDAIKLVLDTLVDKEIGVLKSLDDIQAVGHRVVHGGEIYKDSALIHDEDIKNFEDLIELAPLHNPACITGIKILKKLMPNIPNVAVFDTAFHQTLPNYAFMYPIPYEDYAELKVRKYGFHGTSHKFVSLETQKLLNTQKNNIIVCHLGNGASVSAIKDGKVIDTSMGLTPLAGLMMGTRSGDVDPSIPEYIMEKRNLSLNDMTNRLNKKSGFLGISCFSSDLRDIVSKMNEGDEKSKLAFEMFCYRVRNYIGSYIVALGGLDALVFTGGIGENSSEVRAKICENLEFLGIKLDFEKNKQRISGNVDFSTANSNVRIYKVETNEELMIALDTLRLISDI